MTASGQKGLLAEVYWRWLMLDARARSIAARTERVEGESAAEWRRRVANSLDTRC